MGKREFIVAGDKVTHDVKEEVLMASSREEAVEMFKAKHPGHPVEWVESGEEYWEIIGADENTGKPIFNGDDYCHDEHGIMWFKDENGQCGCEEEE